MSPTNIGKERRARKSPYKRQTRRPNPSLPPQQAVLHELRILAEQERVQMELAKLSRFA